MHYLTVVKEYAEIQGCTEQNVRLLAQAGKLEAVESRNEKNRKKYLIPLTVLPQAQQRKWYRAHHLELPPELRRRLPDTTPADSRTLEEMTEKEREQVNWWLRILEGWDKARSGEPSKADADARYIDYVEQTEGVKLTYSSLYRHQKARLCENWDGLVDSRGKWRSGQSSIPEEAWQVFLSFWLDQRRFSAAKCYEYTRMYLQMNGDTTPLPSISSFHRRIQSDVSEAVQILGRYGQKVYDDRCGPYIQRVYDDLNSNDWWVADNHTFDSGFCNCLAIVFCFLRFATIACFSKPHKDVINNSAAGIRNIKRNELYDDTKNFLCVFKSLRIAEERDPRRNGHRPEHHACSGNKVIVEFM